MPTIDFEVYLNRMHPPAAARASQLPELFANEDAVGIEYAVVMANPTLTPHNRTLYETAHHEGDSFLPGQSQ